MLDIQWGGFQNALARIPNPGEAFQAGMQAGQAQLKERRLDSALKAIGTNPNDPAALNALMQADPRLGLQYRQQNLQNQQMLAKQQADAAEERTKTIGRAAVLAKDPASWDAIVDQLAQKYPDVAAYKGKFDPNLRLALMAHAGEKDDADEGTALQQNYEYLKTVNPTLAEDYLRRQTAEPPLIASNGDGTFTIIPRRQASPQAAPPPVLSDDDWDTGGPGAQAPATFPR